MVIAICTLGTCHSETFWDVQMKKSLLVLFFTFRKRIRLTFSVFSVLLMDIFRQESPSLPTCTWMICRNKIKTEFITG